MGTERRESAARQQENRGPQLPKEPRGYVLGRDSARSSGGASGRGRGPVYVECPVDRSGRQPAHRGARGRCTHVAGAAGAGAGSSVPSPGRHATTVATGGDLVVHTGTGTQPYRSSESALSLVASYADCRHEIQRVRSGYRVVLTFNLLLRGEPSAIEPEHVGPLVRTTGDTELRDEVTDFLTADADGTDDLLACTMAVLRRSSSGHRPSEAPTRPPADRRRRTSGAAPDPAPRQALHARPYQDRRAVHPGTGGPPPGRGRPGLAHRLTHRHLTANPNTPPRRGLRITDSG